MAEKGAPDEKKKRKQMSSRKRDVGYRPADEQQQQQHTITKEKKPHVERERDMPVILAAPTSRLLVGGRKKALCYLTR
jgi:hypothetical protein